MEEIELVFGEVDAAISVMREVSKWGRGRGYRLWPDEWLTREELLTEEAGPENFCVGKLGDAVVCAFILQWSDREYWAAAPKYEAAYLHKFCVVREYAHHGMTKAVVEALKKECRKRGIKRIRLDTALDEQIIRKIYLNAGFRIVDIIDFDNGRSMALYELDV